MKNIDYTQLAKDKLLKKGLKGLANHTSIPKMIGEICSELVINNDVLPLVSTRFVTQEVILFELKDGKYQDAAGNEITNEMLMEYSHDIDDDEGILWL